MPGSLTTLTSLRDLHFRAVDGDSELVMHLTRLTALTALVLEVSSPLTPEAVDALVCNSSLQRLAIGSDWSIRKDRVLALARMPVLQSLTVTMRFLKVAYAEQLADIAGLKHLVVHSFQDSYMHNKDAVALLHAAPGVAFQYHVVGEPVSESE
jgi:hypothetical protein